MLNKILKAFLIVLAFLLLLTVVLVKPVDRTPYSELHIADEINARLDSLAKNYQSGRKDTLRIGFARVSITPSDTVPLAGYAARDPMAFERIRDSVFVRAMVLDNGHNRVALLSTELLINHPGVVSLFNNKLAGTDWQPGQIFLGATHTHSGPGGWAEGIAGNIIIGDYSEKQAAFIARQMEKVLTLASQNLQEVRTAYIANEMGLHVKNRLIKEGEEDIWMRNLLFELEEGYMSFSTYAAHATCFSMHSRELTGDFPSYFYNQLQGDSLVMGVMYMAGAVGSMGPQAEGLRGRQKAQLIGSALAGQVSLMARLGARFQDVLDLQSFQVKVPLRSPQLKIAQNWALREWVFDALFGRYEVEISVLKVGDTILLGMPCDFSGEVANPLYAYAKDRGLNLIISSFNGGYIGYVTKDKWYDLREYETRSMNWYGPDSGAYFSFIAKRIIDTVAE